MKPFYQMACYLFVLLSISIHAAPSAEELISITIKKQWETPQSLVEVPVIAVGTHYALVDWVQDKRGGRALLRLNEGEWQTLMCGSAQLKSTQALERAGVSGEEARKISENLTVQEINLTTEQLELIDGFEGIMNVLTNPRHHHEHH
jgi:hypothetical protein